MEESEQEEEIMENMEIKLDELEEIAGGAGANSYEIYTTVKGDTLKKIAKKFGTSIEVLMKLNRDKIKDKNKIGIGWELLVPKND